MTTAEKITTDAGTIASALHLFFGPTDVFEVRFLGVDDNERWSKSVFMRGRDIDRLADRLATEADDALKMTSFTPHGLSPDVLKRGNCVIAPAVPSLKLSHDEDVPTRRFLIVDVDPTRAEGHAGESATEGEKLAAWGVTTSVSKFLRSLKWAAPLVVDSGNGFHSYYRLDSLLPGGPVVKGIDPLARLLKALAAKFDTPAAHVDLNVYNAARPMKVPGTPSRKGSHTADRPHRLSGIIHEPAGWGTDKADVDVEATIAAILEDADVKAKFDAINVKDTAHQGDVAMDGVETRWAPACEQNAPLQKMIQNYLAKLPRGQGDTGTGEGSARCMAAARVVVWDLDMGVEAGFQFLRNDYGPGCTPAWTDESAIRHKCEDADKQGTYSKPRGGLLREMLQKLDTSGGLNASPASSLRSSLAEVGQTKRGSASDDGIPPGPGEIDDPFRLAGGFVDLPAWKTLRDYQGEFVQWEGGVYRILKNAEVENPLRRWTESVFRMADSLARKNAKDGEKIPTKKQVTTYTINNVIGNIRSLLDIRTPGSPPMWIDGVDGPDPAQLIPLRNGLYDLKAGALLPHSTAFLTFAVAPFDYDPNAPRPAKWLQFLAEVWPDDPDSIACLQEWFGYLLTPDTSMQKILFLLGPPRAGKGTIARVLEAVVGPQNVAAPMLSTLAMDYAVAGLVGKSLALIGDARLSGRTDSAHVAGVLNTISGEDKLTIPRKYKDDLQVRLPTRFVILSNELPRILDPSGALTKRMVLLQFTQSFLGRENRTLSKDIVNSELPGILLWAIEGWRRLRDKGQFTQSKSARESLEEMEDLGSPVGAFIRERCVIQEGASVPMKELFAEWRKWCEEEGRRDPGTSAVFGRDLKAVRPEVKKKKVRMAGETPWVYTGVRLKAFDWEQGQADHVPSVPSVPSNSFIDRVGRDKEAIREDAVEGTIESLLGTPGTLGTTQFDSVKHQFEDLTGE